ncbi:CAP domain-containing protein [Dokdonia pacifica]|nr:CAP domain-containing protein [Dokdonia pacifica]
MIRKLFLIVLVSCFSLVAKAQLNPSQKEELAKLITEKVNKLRKSKGKQPIGRNIDLKKAAQLHSDYMVRTQRLSHNEYGKDTYATPRDRVTQYSDIYIAVGENILYTKPIRTAINTLTLKKIAVDIFRAWKNSPGHYKNMISSEYDYGDLAFTYDPKSKRVYATHVFGRKGYKIPGQLSENAFGIQTFDGDCSSLFNGFQNIVTNMGNAVQIEGNKVILSYHSVSKVKQILTDAKDGIAVDLINKEQFACDDPTQLDASPIYDGVLLKPMYRDALFANNIAKSEYRFVVVLGIIPEHLQGKTIRPSLVFIKNGYKCRYVSPRTIPSGRYPLAKIPPVLYEPEISLKTQGVKEVEELIYPFYTDETVPEKVPELKIVSDQLYAAEIQSYSSVEGTEKRNIGLHNARAAFMKSHVYEQLKDIAIEWDIKAEENWELCEYQMELLGKESIWSKGKSATRAYVNSKSNDPVWERFLSQQRISKTVLYWKGAWSSTDSLHATYNLIDALLKDDKPRTNKALALIYKSKTANPLPLSFLKKRLFSKQELVQNVSALLLKDIDEYQLEDLVFYVRTWLQKAENLSEGAQKNLLNLYAITSRRMLSSWDLSSEQLSRVMHPGKLENLIENYKSEDVVNPLFLNFHMAIIRYYGQINDRSKIDISFDFITNYFREKSLSIEDDWRLALFFNSWSRYDLSLELLSKPYKEGTLDENTLFLLLQTKIGYPYGGELPLQELHQEASQKNERRWCSWIYYDFENLRDNAIKELYCKKCKEFEANFLNFN